MHILLLPSFYISPERPATGSFFRDQGMALQRAGHQVGVLVTPRIDVTLAYIKRVGWRAAQAVSREDYFPDFPVYRMHWGWFPRPLPFMVTRLLRSSGLTAYEHYCHQHGTPDVIHAHNIFYGGYLAAQIKRKSGVPVVLTEHSTSYMEGLIIFPGQPQIIRDTLRTMDARLAVSQALADAMKQYDPDTDIAVIGNVVDTDYFTPDPAARAPQFTFSAIGTLEKRKRHSLLLRAFSQQFKGDPKVVLRIGGSGPLAEQLRQEAVELGIDGQVTFLGHLSREQVRAEMRLCHVHLSTSVIESFGVTLTEAMACGTPLIATRSGGPESFVTPESGLLVPPEDAQALGAAMRTMIEDYAEYDPARIRQLCVERYSEAALVRQLEATYGRLPRNPT